MFYNENAASFSTYETAIAIMIQTRWQTSDVVLKRYTLALVMLGPLVCSIMEEESSMVVCTSIYVSNVMYG